MMSYRGSLLISTLDLKKLTAQGTFVSINFVYGENVKASWKSGFESIEE